MKHDLLIYPMDYKTIENKVFASKYPSTAHFMGDVKQMQHNCYILHSGKSLNSSRKLFRVNKL